MPTVKFLQDDMSVEVPDGSNLGDIAVDANATLPFSCRDGTCGTCLIEVKRGAKHLSESQEKEKATLAIYGGDETKHRLACQCAVHGDVDVDLP